MKRSILVAGASIAATAALAVGPMASSALASSGHSSPESRSSFTIPGINTAPLWPGLPLPTHIYAPYLDVTAVSSIAKTSQESGAKYETLAFLQAPTAGSCDLAWAGNPDQSVASGALADQIAKTRHAGGDVIPSFGGYDADTETTANDPGTLTEIADSCADVGKVAQAYEKVITTYGVHRLDFDIESNSITNTPGVDRRNEAIALVEQWAHRMHRSVQFSYTLPSTPNGLGATGLAVLQSAADHHAVINNVNVMTFDYWDGVDHDMVADAESAATALTSQLKSTIMPHASDAELFRHVGVVQMNGADDYRTAAGVATEVFTPQQAVTFERWAAKKKLAEISIWALQRDNDLDGTCPTTTAQNDCSGVTQKTWAFSHAFEPFTTPWWKQW